MRSEPEHSMPLPSFVAKLDDQISLATPDLATYGPSLEEMAVFAYRQRQLDLMEQRLRGMQLLASVEPPPGLAIVPSSPPGVLEAPFQTQTEQNDFPDMSQISFSSHFSSSLLHSHDSWISDSNKFASNLGLGDAYTTVIIRNVVGNCTRTMLIEFINRCGFSKKYDLVYLPQRFNGGGCFHYAFVNFLTPTIAASFQTLLHGSGDAGDVFGGACAEVEWSECQGLEANIEKFRNSSVMHSSVNEECRPVLFRNGVAVPFPRPTKRIKQDRKNRSKP